MRYLTFVHRSPYATWNSLQAWIRHERTVPEHVVLAHLASVGDHARLVEKGVRTLLKHYGSDAEVTHHAVDENLLVTWQESMRALLDASGGTWTIDITGARTIPKTAVAHMLRPEDPHEVVYLDVREYRYEPKPFPWVPYNLQTVRFLHREREVPDYRNVQWFGPPVGVPPLSQIHRVERVGVDRFEARRSWESLVVLLNEAGAARKGKGPGEGVQELSIKLPSVGVTVADYNLETRRFRLADWQDIRRKLVAARQRLDGLWQDEIPGDEYVLQALTAARLLPFRDQAEFERLFHEIAARTRGPNPGVPLRALAMDTNLFYLDFFTAVAHAAALPMTRVPLVASSVTLGEIRHKMQWQFPPGAVPKDLRDADVHHPHAARVAHSAHEEFEMLRTRCRMHVVDGHGGDSGHAANDANDRAILLDFKAHRKREGQEVIVVSNDRGFVKRGQQDFPMLDVRLVDYGSPEHEVEKAANLDQVAYLVYRLALGYGKVSLKGLGVEVLGDHPVEERARFLHEDVRFRIPDAPWVRGFLHELEMRDKLGRIVANGGLWL